MQSLGGSLVLVAPSQGGDHVLAAAEMRGQKRGAAAGPQALDDPRGARSHGVVEEEVVAVVGLVGGVAHEHHADPVAGGGAGQVVLGDLLLPGREAVVGAGDGGDVVECGRAVDVDPSLASRG